MGVPLVQQLAEVRGHVPCHSLQLIWVHLTGLQPLQIQDVLLTVGQLVSTREGCQSYNTNPSGCDCTTPTNDFSGRMKSHTSWICAAMAALVSKSSV